MSSFDKFRISSDSLTTACNPFDHYLEYVNTISNSGWAVSLKTARILHYTAMQYSGKTIADFGSGFSSAVLRSIEGNKVLSVDHDQAWIEKTKLYLKKLGLSTEGVMSLDDFLKTNESLDFAFYDLGNNKSTRWDNFKKCYERMNVGGTMIIDDIHCVAGYADFVKTQIRSTSRFESLKDQTLDEFGRFAGILYV